MSGSTESDQLRFNHWGAAIVGLAILAAVVVFFGWVDKRRAQSEVDHLHERLCGSLPGGLLQELDRLNSAEQPDPDAFEGLHRRVRRWAGSIREQHYDIQLLREEGPLWQEVSWKGEWRTVHERPVDHLLGANDCETRLLHDGQVAGARRYRGTNGANIVVIALRRRD